MDAGYPPLVAEIFERHQSVRAQIEAAARRSGRDPGLIRLVVVSKKQPVEVIRAALSAGIRDLGENYAEEAEQKIQALGVVPGLRWHMIGHVQSRKADLVVRHFDWMHSLDSLKLAMRLERLAAEAGRRLPVLLECNVSGEVSKFGYAASTPQQWEALAVEARSIQALPHLEIHGLMTMPPFFEDGEQARPYFRLLRELSAFMAEKVPQACWQELSMGTSTDFSVAVEEGATLVRVGTAILGSRPPNA
jgi:pyridoxal phosphate enzyme (YggS family)